MPDNLNGSDKSQYTTQLNGISKKAFCESPVITQTIGDMVKVIKTTKNIANIPSGKHIIYINMNNILLNIQFIFYDYTKPSQPVHKKTQ
jgi:hypothetical protein